MTDTKDVIQCPACGAEMKKILLEKQGFNIDVCLDGCGGIFLDNKEYKKVLEQAEDIDSLINLIAGRDFIQVDTKKKRTCPLCGHKMVKNFSSHLKKIEIDECYNCGGKFLDNQELFEIRGEFKGEKERSEEFKKYIKKLGLQVKNKN